MRLTHDEIIRELTKEVAILNERVVRTREEMKDLKDALEEASRRRWAFLPPLVATLVNVLLSALVAYLVSRK